MNQLLKFKQEEIYMDCCLNELGTFYGGLSGKSKEHFGTGDAKFVTYMNVFSNCIARKDQCESVLISDDEKQNLVKQGDILFTQSSETPEEVGMASIWTHDIDVYLNSFCFGFRVLDPKKTNPLYLTYLLRSPKYRRAISIESQGISRYNLSSSRLSSLKLRLHSSEEQQKIAEFFTALDEKIRILSTQLDSLKSQKDGVMNGIFNQSIRFHSSNGHDYDEWQDVVLKDIAEVKTGPFGSLLHAEDYVECGTPIVTTEHFKNGQLPISAIGIPQVAQHDVERLKNYRLTYGDIVFSRVGSVDINALVEQENDGWLFSGRVLRVRVKDSIDPRFLHYALLDKSVKKDIISRAVGLTMASINTSILEETHIRVPKSIAEQNKISSFIHTLDNKIMLKEQCINTMHLLKKAFMQRMFV